MLKTFTSLFIKLWNAPAGKQVIALCLIIAFGVPMFLGYYYADVMKDNKALKLELKEERLNTQDANNKYIRAIELCEKQRIEIESKHIAKLDEYKEADKKRAEEKIKELEKDLRAIRESQKNTAIIMNRTIKTQKN